MYMTRSFIHLFTIVLFPILVGCASVQYPDNSVWNSGWKNGFVEATPQTDL